MDAVRLPVSKRLEVGDGPSRRLRARGFVPGVLYGKNRPALPIAVRLQDLRDAMAQGHKVLLELVFENGSSDSGPEAKGSRYALVQEVQVHPFKRQVLHVDLHEVDLSSQVEAEVEIEAVGEPEAVAAGAVLEWEKREVTVRALPAQIPESIKLDIGDLRVGEHLTVASLLVPTGVTIVDDPDDIVVTLLPPKIQEAASEESGSEE
ncbi:MAG: 50S ribosomal protein L25 [Thermoleophilia bacterium]|nr:50S ribosomal protein L25 [Thermoleophilia bacterium]